MTVIPPVAAVQAGRTSGGGLLAQLTGAAGAGGAAPTQTSAKADGSVGLFDGVLGKALMGGAAGLAMGFIPFIPGGPILGGIVGALGGAAMGVFSNWRTMSSIKKENEAMLGALGVQASDPQVQQVLQSGNVSQLLPLMEQSAGAGAAATQVTPGTIAQVTDPATGITQLVDVSTGTVVEQSAATVEQQQAAVVQGQLPATVDPSAAPQQSPVPTQGLVTVGSGAVGGAIDPNAAVNPGVAPAMASATPSGGGGSAGDLGRPPAPVGVNSTNAAAVAPTQAGIGMPTTGIADAQAGAATSTNAQLSAMIVKLQAQIDQLKAYLAEQERLDQLDKAQAR